MILVTKQASWQPCPHFLFLRGNYLELSTDSEKYADVATSGFFSLGHFYGLPNLKMRMLFSFKYPTTSLPPSHNAHLSAPLAGSAIVLNIYLVLTVHILLGDVQGSVFRLLFPLFSLESVSLFSFISHPQLTGREFGYHSTVRCCPASLGSQLDEASGKIWLAPQSLHSFHYSLNENASFHLKVTSLKLT